MTLTTLVTTDATARIRAQVRAERRALTHRILMVILALAVAVLLLFCASLMFGSVTLSPAAAISGLTGSGDTATVFVVRELRLPRATAAVLVGLALGAAGTLFQRVLGNPLASPDFLGVAAGAGTATAAALVFGGVAGLALPVYALVGGGVTAILIYAVAWRRGVSEYRFILVGIGIGTFATSVTSYLVARAEFSDARAAMTWLTGSVGMATPETTALVSAALLALVPTGFAVSRMLRRLELGDDTARMLGARVERDRLVVLAVGVILVSVATAAVGPIMFVAMLAGPLAQILIGASGRSILAAALVGAVVLQIADLLAQHALPWPISTGVVTGAFGAPYIAWMLISAARRTRAA
ncbi:FecCD family ABC transporter permease [Microbacterium sp. NPDC077663]|uniref:FecCD family ABC transporter permease n=1 Tax=Microbacterium sp. NPDC077663 TaxID=3364189 RepID=UPI0037C7F58B